MARSRSGVRKTSDFRPWSLDPSMAASSFPARDFWGLGFQMFDPKKKKQKGEKNCSVRGETEIERS